MKTFFKALGNIFRKPVTTKYPFEKTYIPDNYRGLIHFDESLCIWCRRCEMACPPGAIVFSQDMEGKQEYHYNRAVCIYCAECVRSCPKEGCLIQTAEPAPCALKEENINNGWNKLFDEALKSRDAYSAEKKKKAAEKAAAAKSQAENKPAT
ncbi:MAG TPA: 4Fe-4S dicluster domain-containing protein [Chitinophagaceae bacterium]|nr:4Fe-4S dicluster domain-containing protein [Chitinophagaceae bacterium]